VEKLLAWVVPVVLVNMLPHPVDQAMWVPLVVQL
jgi:hypothetical protein